MGKLVYNVVKGYRHSNSNSRKDETIPCRVKFEVKPPFLRDTENGRNSWNQGVENGKWQVSFSVLPSNASQCTSTTDSQEHALNCTAHKILLTVFTVNQLIPLLSDSYSNTLSKPIVFFD